MLNSTSPSLLSPSGTQRSNSPSTGSQQAQQDFGYAASEFTGGQLSPSPSLMASTISHDTVPPAKARKTEYKSKFTPFDQYAYNEVTDSFVKQTTNLESHPRPPSSISGSKSNQDLAAVSINTQEAGFCAPSINGGGEDHQQQSHCEPWYKEVVKRNEKANEYRFKSEVGHQSPLLGYTNNRSESPYLNSDSARPLNSPFGAADSTTGTEQVALSSSDARSQHSDHPTDSGQQYRFTPNDYKRDHMIAHMANNNNFSLPKEKTDNQQQAAPRRAQLSSSTGSRTTAQVRSRSQSTRRQPTSTTANIYNRGTKTQPVTAKSSQTTPTRTIAPRQPAARPLQTRPPGRLNDNSSKPTSTATSKTSVGISRATTASAARRTLTSSSNQATKVLEKPKPTSNGTSTSNRLASSSLATKRVAAPPLRTNPVTRTTASARSTTRTTTTATTNTSATATGRLPPTNVKAPPSSRSGSALSAKNKVASSKAPPPSSSSSSATTAVKSIKTPKAMAALEAAAASAAVSNNLNEQPNQVAAEQSNNKPQLDLQEPAVEPPLIQSQQPVVENKMIQPQQLRCYDSDVLNLVCADPQAGNVLADELAQAEMAEKVRDNFNDVLRNEDKELLEKFDQGIKASHAEILTQAEPVEDTEANKDSDNDEVLVKTEPIEEGEVNKNFDTTLETAASATVLNDLNEQPTQVAAEQSDNQPQIDLQEPVVEPLMMQPQQDKLSDSEVLNLVFADQQAGNVLMDELAQADQPEKVRDVFDIIRSEDKELLEGLEQEISADHAKPEVMNQAEPVEESKLNNYPGNVEVPSRAEPIGEAEVKKNSEDVEVMSQAEPVEENESNKSSDDDEALIQAEPVEEAEVKEDPHAVEALTRAESVEEAEVKKDFDTVEALIQAEPVEEAEVRKDFDNALETAPSAVISDDLNEQPSQVAADQSDNKPQLDLQELMVEPLNMQPQQDRGSDLDMLNLNFAGSQAGNILMDELVQAEKADKERDNFNDILRNEDKELLEGFEQETGASHAEPEILNPAEPVEEAKINKNSDNVQLLVSFDEKNDADERLTNEEDDEFVNGLAGGLISTEDQFDSSEREISSDGNNDVPQATTNPEPYAPLTDHNYNDEPYSIIPTSSEEAKADDFIIELSAMDDKGIIERSERDLLATRSETGPDSSDLADNELDTSSSQKEDSSSSPDSAVDKWAADQLKETHSEEKAHVEAHHHEKAQVKREEEEEEEAIEQEKAILQDDLDGSAIETDSNLNETSFNETLYLTALSGGDTTQDSSQLIDTGGAIVDDTRLS